MYAVNQDEHQRRSGIRHYIHIDPVEDDSVSDLIPQPHSVNDMHSSSFDLSFHMVARF